MAAFYPNGSLPVLLTGESGTGKSFFALCIIILVQNDLLEESAPL